jgi:hypothetical protein
VVKFFNFNQEYFMVKKYSLTVILMLWSCLTHATPAVDELLTEYRQQGADNFTVEAGQALFFKTFPDEAAGKTRQCTTCHTDNLRQQGQHVRTGKSIEPLAPSINPNSLIKVKNIRKWLKRNCKWTLKRECTPQEKGDVLTFIQAQ